MSERFYVYLNRQANDMLNKKAKQLKLSKIDTIKRGLEKI